MSIKKIKVDDTLQNALDAIEQRTKSIKKKLDNPAESIDDLEEKKQPIHAKKKYKTFMQAS